jgi:hypothetical protein
VQDNPHNRALFDVANRANDARFCSLTVDRDAASDALQRVCWWVPIQQNLILLVDLEARVHDAVRHLTVVSQQQQPLRLAVEPPNGYDTLIDRDEVHHRVAPAFIGHRRDVAARLVQHNVAQARSRDELSVHLDLLSFGVDLGAELRDDLPIDTHPSLNDHLLGTPS